MAVCTVQCVKALVYINQDGLLNIDSTNDLGDTALHLAIKWGYGTFIVQS